MATPLGRLPVWMRQSTLSPAAFRMLSAPVAGSALVARTTWLPPRLTIRNVSPAKLASMATTSLRKVLSRLGGGATVSALAICLFRFLFWSPAPTSAWTEGGNPAFLGASVSTALTRACTFTLNTSGGSGWAPILGRKRRLPRINADRSWLGNTPCGLFVFAGSVTGKSGLGQKMRDWPGGTVLQKILVLTRLAIKPESARRGLDN